MVKLSIVILPPGCPAARLSGSPAVRQPGSPPARLPGCQAVRLSGCPAVRLSGCPAVRLSGCPAVRPFSLPVTSSSRHPKRGITSIDFDRFCSEMEIGLPAPPPYDTRLIRLNVTPSACRLARDRVVMVSISFTTTLCFGGIQRSVVAAPKSRMCTIHRYCDLNVRTLVNVARIFD